MPQLYRRAAVFVFPSTYEGFGMPTLEALASGTRVVLADASCSREVGGEVASYARPRDVDAFTRALRDILASPPTDAWRDAARDHASRFTWDAMTAAYAATYRRLAGRS